MVPANGLGSLVLPDGPISALPKGVFTVLLINALLLASPPKEAPKALAPQGLIPVSTLAPWVQSAESFADPANQKAISEALKLLTHLRHPFFYAPGSSSSGVGELFAQQTELAERDFSDGKTESARFRVQALTQLCLGCHLREPAHDFIDSAEVVEKLKLPPLQQAQYYATTRQFGRALEVWRAELGKPVALEAEQIGQLDALRLALRVAVRARDDSALALALMAPMLATNQMPGFAQRDLQAWSAEAQGWQQERFVVSRQSSKALFARARLLINSTGAATHAGTMPQHFVSLLRAAAYLDEAIRRDPKAKFRGEALFLLGVAHASITDSSMWQLEWMYFEACIRENAASARGTACATRLEERTRLIWPTAADVPSSTQVALKDLVKLARVQKN